MKVVIESHKAANLAELLLILKRMSLNPLNGVCDSYVCINGAPVTVTLECETLTDRSEVWSSSLGGAQ